MVRIIKNSAFKTAAAIFLVSALSIVSAIALKYNSPVDIEQACTAANLPLVNNINSCTLVDQVLMSLETDGYSVAVLENTKYSGGPFRAKFNRQIFEVKDFRINNGADIGVAHFKFINGHLSSIVYFPTKVKVAFNLHPETTSKDITVRHSTNYQGKKYISWTNEQLETYITWWLLTFS